jgi:hypothetical protein
MTGCESSPNGCRGLWVISARSRSATAQRPGAAGGADPGAGHDAAVRCGSNWLTMGEIRAMGALLQGASGLGW